MSKQMLNEQTFAQPTPFDAGARTRTNVMTVGGTVARALVLFAIAVPAAVFGWTHALDVLTTSNGVVLIGFLALIGLSIATAARPQIAVITGPIYALVMGVWAGAISALYEAAYPGIVLQAVFSTFAVFLACLVLYATRIVKVTDRFVFVVIVATAGIMLTYLAALVLQLFGIRISFLYDASPLGILISVGICIIAALNLFLDFRFIEQGVAKQAPVHMAWYAALALLSTLIWLYLEILRLLGRVRS
jgi:uncharacterized YccA/Bax inhibitor family protein